MDENEIDQLIKTGRYQDPKYVIGKFNMVEVTKEAMERLNNFIKEKKISENSYFESYYKISKTLFDSCLNDNLKGFMNLINLFYQEHIQSTMTELIALEYLNKPFKDDNSRIYSAKDSITKLIELSYKYNDFLFGCIKVLKESDVAEIQKMNFTQKKGEFESYSNRKYRNLLLNEEFRHIRNSNYHTHTEVNYDKKYIKIKDKEWEKIYSFKEFYEKIDEIVSWHSGIGLALSETMIPIAKKIEDVWKNIGYPV